MPPGFQDQMVNIKELERTTTPSKSLFIKTAIRNF